ncbi:electron transfer flavoprotein subunit alpha/FixB family protein [Propionivibrio dicarboxylicus]|uniref:Electron transfer flavoprotein subunit alpha n=1 Tax=Propionivibrio dicarboxylicus TaxID=83767 RepID=A0A1G7Y1P0_9RHOO|nr:FAD-binding protein [Propionivibrio dicarboxylicus]SDG90311.1 electron transfer flavoprotein alpha subunit apoprotein [Propionivibrio dicarboxylicus]
MSVLVIAEHDHRRLFPATRHAVFAAQQLGLDVDVLVAGCDCRDVAVSATALAGVRSVLLAEAAHYAAQTAENLAALVAAQAGPYSHVLTSASAFGKNLLPRIAALLDVEQVSDVCRILSADTFVRPVYAGNALATVRNANAKKVLSIRAAAFSAVEEGGNGTVLEIAASPDLGLVEVLRRDRRDAGRAELGLARVVVAGGRGVGSCDDFNRLLTPLADKLGAALGASYGAVSAGYAAPDLQIGQTGKIIAPDLYVAVGISGAIQHLAGIKDAKIIVAINKDPEAPIFKVADYGLVADLFEAVPALVAALG